MYFLQSSYYRYQHISLYDLILLPLLFFIVTVWAYIYKQKKGKQGLDLYRHFHWAVIAKMLAVIAFCMAYLTVYGGDTSDYFNSACAMNSMLSTDPDHYFKLLFEGNKPEYISFFTPETGYPESHMFRDPRTFFVVRFFSPIILLCGNSLLLSSVVISLLSLIGMWRFYRLLCGLYPNLQSYFFFSALLVPSVLFWGSGLLKDSITMTATAWISYSIFMVFFNRKRIFANVIVILIMAWLIVSIKPYILVSLVPGLLIWLFFGMVRRIKNKMIRMLIMPATLAAVFLAAGLLLSNLGQFLGVYGDVDSMITKVKVTQEDLQNIAAYGSNYYDIGVIEPSVWGLVKKTPQALMAGLFRPFLWEARNPFIGLAGLENLGLLCILIFILIKVGLRTFFRAIIRDPFLTYAFVFTFLFAFGVGLASTNFGALVRYRIPLLPFFVSGLFIMLDFYRRQKAEKEKLLEEIRSGGQTSASLDERGQSEK